MTNTGPIAVVVFGVNTAFFYLYFRRQGLHEHRTNTHPLLLQVQFEPFRAVRDLKLMRLSLVVFTFTITLLMLHQLLDLIVAFVAVLGAVIVLILGGRDMPELVEKIDWHTLLFLGGLFVIVGGLEETGVLHDAAIALGGLSGGNVALLLSILLWSSALLSSVLDNIPFTAAMVPIIRDLSAQPGLSLPPLAWSLALGADFGGNATPVGASANIVGLAVAEKGGIRVSWKEYMRIAFPATILAVAVANILLVLRYA